MKEELVWYPGTNSRFNHLYPAHQGNALCGSKASPKRDRRGWGNNYWQAYNCPRCQALATVDEQTTER